MRVLLQSLACCFVFVVCIGSARATKINIFDPSGFTTNPITTSPFTIGGATPFTACSAGELPDPSLVELGCFAGVNRTGSDWTALELVIPNFGTSFTCNTDDAADQIFSTTSCTYNAATNAYDLIFSGGTLSNHELFFITEDDIDPSNFPDITVFATSATPEPSTLLLMLTGLAAVAGLLSLRRQRDTC